MDVVDILPSNTNERTEMDLPRKSIKPLGVCVCVCVCVSLFMIFCPTRCKQVDANRSKASAATVTVFLAFER